MKRLSSSGKLLSDEVGDESKEVKNSQEKKETIPLQHVTIQRETLPTQPDELKSGDVVIVGRSVDRQDLRGARGLVISPIAKAGKKGFIVKVPPHGDIELVRTQIIFLQKGAHPTTPEAKSLLEEQKRYNESNIPSAVAITCQPTPTYL